MVLSLYNRLADTADGLSSQALPLLARIIFAGTLLIYYINSGLTKFGDGILGLFRPSAGAYIQIFPKAFEAVGYDPSQMSIFHWAVAVAGTWAEILLPFAIVVGLATRLAALGMIGFVVVQSVVDITGHGLGAADIGSWFDGNPSALIVDQRAFWIMLLLVLVVKGAGALSVDRLLKLR